MKLGLYDISEYPYCYYDASPNDALYSPSDDNDDVNTHKFYSKEIEWRYCVIGSIIPEHIDNEGIVRYGTKSFPGGRKVYLSKSFWPATGTITAMGLDRHKSKYTTEDISLDLVENIRISKTYVKRALEIMSNFEFPDTWWGNTKKELKRCKEFASALNEYKSLKKSGLI